MSLPRVAASGLDFGPAARLDGRVVLVCGATGGLGRAAALALAAGGATVVLLGRKVSALEAVYDAIVAAGGPQPAIYPLNLEGATVENYLELGRTLLAEFGRLDGLLHAAVRLDALTPLAHLSATEWLGGLQVNLAAPWLLTRGCLEALEASGDAALVHVLDAPGRCQRAYWGPYAVAKAGLDGLMTVMADEWRRGPLRVHGLQPGPMRTHLRTRIWAAENPAAVPEPTRAASAVAWLMSPAGQALRGKTLDLEA